jgi:hypothetical protein
LVFHSEIKHERSNDIYIDDCTRVKIMGIIWLKGGIWKLRGIMWGFYIGK